MHRVSNEAVESIKLSTSDTQDIRVALVPKTGARLPSESKYENILVGHVVLRAKGWTHKVELRTDLLPGKTFVLSTSKLVFFTKMRRGGNLLHLSPKSMQEGFHVRNLSSNTTLRFQVIGNPMDLGGDLKLTDPSGSRVASGQVVPVPQPVQEWRVEPDKSVFVPVTFAIISAEAEASSSNALSPAAVGTDGAAAAAAAASSSSSAPAAASNNSSSSTPAAAAPDQGKQAAKKKQTTTLRVMDLDSPGSEETISVRLHPDVSNEFDGEDEDMDDDLGEALSQRPASSKGPKSVEPHMGDGLRFEGPEDQMLSGFRSPDGWSVSQMSHGSEVLGSASHENVRNGGGGAGGGGPMSRHGARSRISDNSSEVSSASVHLERSTTPRLSDSAIPSKPVAESPPRLVSSGASASSFESGCDFSVSTGKTSIRPDHSSASLTRSGRETQQAQRRSTAGVVGTRDPPVSTSSLTLRGCTPMSGSATRYEVDIGQQEFSDGPVEWGIDIENSSRSPVEYDIVMVDDSAREWLELSRSSGFLQAEHDFHSVTVTFSLDSFGELSTSLLVIEDKFRFVKVIKVTLNVVASSYSDAVGGRQLAAELTRPAQSEGLQTLFSFLVAGEVFKTPGLAATLDLGTLVVGWANEAYSFVIRNDSQLPLTFSLSHNHADSGVVQFFVDSFSALQSLTRLTLPPRSHQQVFLHISPSADMNKTDDVVVSVACQNVKDHNFDIRLLSTCVEPMLRVRKLGPRGALENASNGSRSSSFVSPSSSVAPWQDGVDLPMDEMHLQVENLVFDPGNLEVNLVVTNSHQHKTVEVQLGCTSSYFHAILRVSARGAAVSHMTAFSVLGEAPGSDLVDSHEGSSVSSSQQQLQQRNALTDSGRGVFKCTLPPGESAQVAICVDADRFARLQQRERESQFRGSQIWTGHVVIWCAHDQGRSERKHMLLHFNPSRTSVSLGHVHNRFGANERFQLEEQIVEVIRKLFACANCKLTILQHEAVVQELALLTDLLVIFGSEQILGRSVYRLASLLFNVVLREIIWPAIKAPRRGAQEKDGGLLNKPQQQQRPEGAQDTPDDERSGGLDLVAACQQQIARFVSCVPFPEPALASLQEARKSWLTLVRD